MTRERISTMTRNGPPPEAACALYIGEVMHQRLRPFGHRLAYRVFSLLVDLDRLDELDRMSPLFSVDAANLVAFRQSDHVAEGSVRAHADRLLAQAGLDRPAARILLLCYPRIFGYVFNPISVYFAYDDAGALVALIYAVRNTFGEMHTYVARIEPGDMSDAGVRQTRRKLFHVSPFVGMDARYHFHVLPPGETVRLRINETEAGEPLLAASFGGSVAQLDSAALTACLLKIPLMTWKITAGIHWEALKLWLKGARFHRSPPAPAPASFGDSEASTPPGE